MTGASYKKEMGKVESARRKKNSWAVIGTQHPISPWAVHGLSMGYEIDWEVMEEKDGGRKRKAASKSSTRRS